MALVFLSVHLSLVALEAWRWMLGDGGLALEAWRWRPRGPSPCVAVLLARCLRVGVAFEFVGVCVESGVSLGRPVSAVLRSCGPVVLRVCFVLSCCQRCMRHDLAPPMSAAVPAAALAAATREVALEAWRWSTN